MAPAVAGDPVFASGWNLSFPRTWGRALGRRSRPRIPERAPLAGMRRWDAGGGVRGWGPGERVGSGVGLPRQRAREGLSLSHQNTDLELLCTRGALNLGSRWQRPGPTPRVHGFGKPFINGSLGEEPLPGFPIPKMLN